MSEFHSSVFEIWRVKNGPNNSTISPSNACNSKQGGWIQQAFCTKTFHSLPYIFAPISPVYVKVTFSRFWSPPTPTPTTRLPAPSPITRLLLNRSQWNLACFYRMLRPWCLPNFIDIDWEMKELLGFKMPKTAFLGAPQKAVKLLYLPCNKVDKGCVLAVNSAHYTRASGKITALCNKCEQGNLDLNIYHRDSLWILKPRNGTLVTFPQKAETGAKKWIPTK